jgi:GT2 family glycosyltransferase
MKLAVVIPSKTASNVGPCLRAIIERDPNCARIVVDDGVDWSAVDVPRDQFSIVPGSRPFVFARNCNIGIRKALNRGADGVVLMNDDALLKTPDGFSTLAGLATLNPEYGIIAAVTNSAGNPKQFPKVQWPAPLPREHKLRDEPRMVCFVCVYIPRTTIESVGYLDERFVWYGMDDDDYSFMVRKAGFKLGIYDGCFVDHLSLKSSFRGDPRTPSDFRQNMQLFIDKWGTDNWGLPATEARQKWAI